MIRILPKTNDELKAEYILSIQSFMDKKAQEKGYDNIVSACSYTGYPNAFQEEAVIFGTWRSEVWKYSYEQLALILSGNREIPSVSGFLEELPVLNIE